ncbi:MAG: zf-HC2 domain-containing protein [Firmicutes bacterium]|nr:zf-HC2 domain-containing protein [Bacillota bacterium]MCD7782623.1 zf-HC2 domain-containing protein [Bacillota bacterium]MCD7788424.1 zf-HC2 domain-containing protein [Bacillota bacterium]MCD7830960.1 zf-HC2 domain-containing protein [Bacillota bacterium]MCD8311139.1 zf-HC2 domain-containing protein [Bacillota bacterium]
MKNCDIVRDLLPLYIDHETSEESSEMIKEHLAECEECREIYKSAHNVPRSMQTSDCSGSYRYSGLIKRIRKRRLIEKAETISVCAALLTLGLVLGHILFPKKSK